jgi:putative peptide zinc metalloprotease protein
MGDQAISEQDAITIVKWLIDSGLASTDASRTSGRLMETFEESDRKKRLAKMNPVSPKFNLFNPDAVLSQLTALLGWLFSFPLFFVWSAVVATAVYQVASHWDQVVGGGTMVLASDNWIWLGLSWIFLKLIHETAHGMACKRFGGDVRQCGIVLIVMIPLPFVDVTSSWRFGSKWQRIFVAAAGMYVEVFIAALAAIVWCYSDVGPIRQHAFNLMLAGSVTTLLFNANPLMRFDGYYMLSDWLEMPNLGTHGQQWMKWVGKKYYLGLDGNQPTWPEGRGWIVATYATLALFLKVMICVGLSIAAESLFFGAGIILAMIALVFWVVWPIVKLLKMVFIGEDTQQRPSRIRFCLTTLALGAVCWTVFTEVPWYARVKAAAIVDFQESHEVRTPVAGFLDEILVESGAFVQAGDILARLRNNEVVADVEKLEIELVANDIKMRQLRQNKELAALDVESKNREAIKHRLSVRRQQLASLTVVANFDGVLVADELESQLGVYLAPGQKICNIESDSEKEIHAMIGQRDRELFQNRVGQAVDVHVWGMGPGHFTAGLRDLNPRGRLDLPHPAFGATSGGPLPVKYRPPSGNEEESEQAPMELVDPHFFARVELPAAIGKELKSGQPAFISIRTSRGSVGEVLSEKVATWIRNMRKLNQLR